MSLRQFVALGTSSQVPTRRRNHNGYFLHWDDHGLLFDPGEGTQRQMIYAGLAASDITKVLITHFHGDHCLGLAGIIQRISLDRVPHTVEVLYPEYGSQYVDRLRTSSVFHDVANLARTEFDAEDAAAGAVATEPGFRIEARPLDHSIESWGYRLVEPDGVTMMPEALEARGVRGPAIGKLKSEGEVLVDGQRVTLDEVSTPWIGQKIAFVMDTRVCDAAYELARDADLFVCESTYLSSEATDAAANGHMTAAQAAEIARASGASKLVLTHFSPRYGSPEAFVDEASAIHGDVVAVNDGDRVDVPKRSRPLE